ncbi:MAG: ABC transporter substrate-binding protein [Nitrososphaeria archaeon]
MNLQISYNKYVKSLYITHLETIGMVSSRLIVSFVIVVLVGALAGYAAGLFTVTPTTTTLTTTKTVPGPPTTTTLTVTQTGAATTVTQTATEKVTQTTTQTVTQPTTITQTLTVTRTATITATAAAPGLPEVIKIGVLCDISGPIGPVGSHFYQGAHIAAKFVNDTGGIGGRPIKLIVEDSKSDPQATLDATRKLIEVDGVQVIVGPMISVETLTVAKYVNDRRVPVIATIASSAKITELGDDYVFRVISSDVQASGSTLAAFLKEKGVNRILTFVVSDDYGIGVEEYLKKQLGERVISSIRIDPKKADYRSELVAAKAANPDAIAWVIWIENAKIVFRQAGEIGLTVPLSIATNVVYNPVLFEDPRVAEFTVAANLHVNNEKIAKGTYIYDRFATTFKKIYGEEPWEPGAKLYYDATMLAITAIAKAGLYDGAKIKEALTAVSQHYIGPSGYCAFDENGDQAIVDEQEIYKVERTAEGKYQFKAVAVWDPLTGKITWY